MSLDLVGYLGHKDHTGFLWRGSSSTSYTRLRVKSSIALRSGMGSQFGKIWTLRFILIVFWKLLERI
jgi:hypothetical protein